MMKLSKKAVALSSLLLSTSIYAGQPVAGDDWLHVEGNKIVDEQGNQVWLTGANWFGFNASERTFHGLWSVNLDSTIKSITERGINLLRVPISTELLVEWSQGITAIPSINTHANPTLEGKNNLEVFDEVIAVSKKYGLKILLDVHSAEADNSGHVAPMWYKGNITSADFKASWEWVTARYANDDTLIAFDIQNEPHGKPWGGGEFAKWDNSTDQNNWKFACEDVSNAILAINPKVLVLCEGIESYPIDGVNWTAQSEDDYHNNWWGGNLRGVRDYPINLGVNQDQLVYSPHDYGPLVFKQPWFYPGFNKDTLYQDVWKDNWMFIHEEGISPLLLGEWGGFMDGGDNEKWMVAIRDLIIEHELHHTFWCINPNSGDTGGLLNNDWTTWDEEKYTLFEPSLWKDTSGKYVGLDHQVVLGGAATGTNVTEFYANSTPAVAITAPTSGSDVIVASSVTINYSLTLLSGAAVYIDNVKVGNGTNGLATVTAPATAKAFTVKLVGLDQAGQETAQSASISLNAVEEVVLPPSVEITSPVNGATVAQGSTLSVAVTVQNAAGYQASFDGVTQTVTSGANAEFTATSSAGLYPLVVTAIDSNLQPLAVSKTIDIEITETSTPTGNLSCTLGTDNIWPGGFVLNDITVTNTGTETIDTWSVALQLADNVQVTSGWGGAFVTTGNTVTVSALAYNGTLAPNQSVSFGMQGTYTGNFVVPSCQ